MGRPDPGRYLGALAHSFFLHQRDAADRLVGPYFLGIIAISVILTPLFNPSRGCLLIAVLYHFQMMNPLWSDAQPWDNLNYVGLAVVVVWLNRRTMFDRSSGVTGLVTQAEENPGTRIALAGD